MKLKKKIINVTHDEYQVNDISNAKFFILVKEKLFVVNHPSNVLTLNKINFSNWTLESTNITENNYIVQNKYNNVSIDKYIYNIGMDGLYRFDTDDYAYIKIISFGDYTYTKCHNILKYNNNLYSILEYNERSILIKFNLNNNSFTEISEYSQSIFTESSKNVKLFILDNENYLIHYKYMSSSDNMSIYKINSNSLTNMKKTVSTYFIDSIESINNNCILIHDNRYHFKKIEKKNEELQITSFSEDSNIEYTFFDNNNNMISLVGYIGERTQSDYKIVFKEFNKTIYESV